MEETGPWNDLVSHGDVLWVIWNADSCRLSGGLGSTNDSCLVFSGESEILLCPGHAQAILTGICGGEVVASESVDQGRGESEKGNDDA